MLKYLYVTKFIMKGEDHEKRKKNFGIGFVCNDDFALLALKHQRGV